MFIKYDSCVVNPSYETIQYLPLEIFLCSTGCISAKIHIMPHFKPNDYLFKTHADKGSERWEIFAWAVRHAMMKEGNFKSCEQSLKDKLAYEKYMQHIPNAQDPSVGLTTPVSPAKKSEQELAKINEESPLNAGDTSNKNIDIEVNNGPPPKTDDADD